jgi:hypothetical protein
MIGRHQCYYSAGYPTVLRQGPKQSITLLLRALNASNTKRPKLIRAFLYQKQSLIEKLFADSENFSATSWTFTLCCWLSVLHCDLLWVLDLNLSFTLYAVCFYHLTHLLPLFFYPSYFQLTVEEENIWRLFCSHYSLYSCDEASVKEIEIN